MLTPNELVLPFAGSYICANFGENWSRNATVRVLADWQTQTDFIICPMLYAVAMGQIVITIMRQWWPDGWRVWDYVQPLRFPELDVKLTVGFP